MSVGSKSRHLDRDSSALSALAPTSNPTTTAPILPQPWQSTLCSSYPYPLEDDLFAGLRLGLNDEASTELLAGVIADAQGDATALNLEASRRFGDGWKVELEARAWNGVERDDPMFPLRSDDHVQLTLTRFF